MCFWKNNKKKEEAIAVLQSYVINATLNQELYIGKANEKEVQLLDSLFQQNSLPMHLYRWSGLREDCEEGNVISEKGYLSCTIDAQHFMNHVLGEHITCFIISTNTQIPSIIVNSILPDANDEGEVILPRDTKFLVTKSELYTENEFNIVLDKINVDDIKAKALVDLYNIKTIRLVYLDLAD